MTFRELIAAAEVYVDLPERFHLIGGFDSRNVALLGLGPAGQGNHRDYGDSDLRRLVSWCLVGDVTGRESGYRSPAIHHDAMRLLEVAEHGWVVMSEGRASWVSRPSSDVFRGGAVCIPVPDWDRHL